MLPPILPLASVLPAVGPSEGALAVLLVLLIAATIGAAICPDHLTIAMQAVLLPLPGVGATIRPLVRADAVDVVLLEGPDVRGPIGPGEGALAMLGVPMVRPFIPGAIWPLFHAVAVLQVGVPLPLVAGPVLLHMAPEAVGFVLPPLPVVGVPAAHQPSAPVRHVVLELALVAAALPLQQPKAVAHFSEPLARVPHTSIIVNAAIIVGGTPFASPPAPSSSGPKLVPSSLVTSATPAWSEQTQRFPIVHGRIFVFP
eukprot:CAMPEP_0181527454 /NCGR_PEP_ID=MMETSP1110-20121109/70012_1 /TAXON_ID=174948 /ORGANISM="Symbiodinium sp., Strain CCMP421" /LENGTH=255 /DNA_ID=CAMNT_0023658331 /DNA_START=178 /DNA_END=943 /DNA_ORIENTATION=-